MARGGGVGLLKTLEQALRLFCRQADAGVGHFEFEQHVVAQFFLDGNGRLDAAQIGEFHSIIDIVDQDLPQPQRVPNQTVRHIGRHLNVQLESLGTGFSGCQVDDVADHVVKLERNPLNLQLSGLNLGDIQNVVQHGQKMLPRLLNFFDMIELARRQIGLAHQVGHADDGVHGGSDFMAHIGQKIAFGLAGRIGCLLGAQQFRLGAFLL